jgi:transposase
MTNRLYKRGPDREQLSLLPARIEDYVDRNNPVRAIEAYVAGLRLEQLGFRHAESRVAAGQPSYDPADLLKLYLYGYLNRVRSSRRLETEAGRNLEVMWLLRGLTPGYRTIATFRQENWAALKAANREFVLFARSLDLLGGELVAIDGAFFHGDASKGSIKTQKRLSEQLAAVERDIEAYGKSLEANDAAEEARRAAPLDGGNDGAGLAEKLARLLAKRAERRDDLAELQESGETQLSKTDADARLLSKRGQSVAGYNVQIAVDDKHKLIVASEVVNDGNDTGQLYAMAQAAKDVLRCETLQVVADAGYYNGTELKHCEDHSLTAYVPQARRGGRGEARGRLSQEEFSYVAQADAYRCPAGEFLRRSSKLKNNGGRLEIRYTSRKASCNTCALRTRCVEQKSGTRTVCRWVHEDVIERHLARMKGATALVRRRGSLVEHPFGTLKCRAGYRHFLVRGFQKVRGEWSLMALCYNFSRLLSILGFDRFMAILALRKALLTFLLRALIAFWAAIRELHAHSARSSPSTRPRFLPAA